MSLITLLIAIAISATTLSGNPASLERNDPGGAVSPSSAALRPSQTARFDWPQWQGPDRTGMSMETGLMKQWPKSGPAVAWSASGLGSGYGSVAILADRIYVQGTQGSNSVVFCLNRSDGKKLWTRALGRSLDDDKGGGPRGTPTVEPDHLYVLTEGGDLACLKTADGSVVWARNILQEFGGTNPRWKLSESPLVDGNRLIVTPGGPRAGVVALDKSTGKTVWTSRELSDRAAYSSCVIVNVQGIRAYTTLTESAAVGVRADDGKLLWRYTRVANRTANITTPLVVGDKVFYTTNYATGCALLGLTPQDGLLQAREIYFNRDMINHHGGVVLVDGFLYGFSNTILTCMEFGTGKVMWKDRSVGKGTVTYADGNLYLMGEENTVGLAEATPEGYREKGRFRIEDQGWPSWAHLVVCEGKLYLRNQGTLTAYQIR